MRGPFGAVPGFGFSSFLFLLLERLQNHQKPRRDDNEQVKYDLIVLFSSIFIFNLGYLWFLVEKSLCDASLNKLNSGAIRTDRARNIVNCAS